MLARHELAADVAQADQGAENGPVADDLLVFQGLADVGRPIARLDAHRHGRRLDGRVAVQVLPDLARAGDDDQAHDHDDDDLERLDQQTQQARHSPGGRDGQLSAGKSTRRIRGQQARPAAGGAARADGGRQDGGGPRARPSIQRRSRLGGLAPGLPRHGHRHGQGDAGRARGRPAPPDRHPRPGRAVRPGRLPGAGGRRRRRHPRARPVAAARRRDGAVRLRAAGGLAGAARPAAAGVAGAAGKGGRGGALRPTGDHRPDGGGQDRPPQPAPARAGAGGAGRSPAARSPSSRPADRRPIMRYGSG